MNLSVNLEGKCIGYQNRLQKHIQLCLALLEIPHRATYVYVMTLLGTDIPKSRHTTNKSSQSARKRRFARLRKANLANADPLKNQLGL